MRKSKKIQIRVTKKDWDRVHWLALHYAKGNLSKWIRYAILEVPAKLIK